MPKSRTAKVLIVIGIILAVVVVAPFIITIFVKESGDKIGIVEIEGTIIDSKSAMDDIVRFKEDENVKGVIVRINSPGGGAAASQEIHREVKKLREKKKVFVSMASVCASGGYYIATAGEKIYASPSTITGSIGVIMQQTVVEDLMKKIGIQANTIKSGELKDAGTPFRKMSENERKYLNDVLTDIHEQFIKDVAEGRKIPVDTVRQLSDGRIFTGIQAKNAGLVDTIGTFYDAVDGLKVSLNILEKPVLVYGKKPFSLLRWLISSVAREYGMELDTRSFKYMYNQ
ncbi:MAG TPA: signal peptide peptidase SppA [Syntrophorhabdaceae bacterium]|nr:signal peptide peptidase SppA [Syntrophorhabdaceae bacterium]HQM81973.1 signal peptide peptidase SppA [Syntrophorhabdaceae bacterium]